MSSLLTDRRGRLRIGAHSGLYRRARDGGVADFGSAGFLEPGVNRNVVQALLESRDGWIWVGTEHAGLRLLAPDAEPGDAATTRAWVMPTRVSGDRAAPVVQTADDAIWWVGMNGLRSLRKRTRDDWGDAELVLHGLSSGLTTLVHEWVTEDQVGDLWIAGDGSGALRVTRRGFTTFTEADGLDSRAVHASTAASDGAVVAVTERMRHSWYRTPAPASVSSSPAARRACALPASIDSRRRGIGGPRNAFAMDAAGLRGSASSRVPRRTRRARP